MNTAGDIVYAHTLGASPRLSPVRAFYDVLVRTGYVKNKRDLARLLRLNEGNVYAYLYDPDPRDDNPEDVDAGRNRARIVATSDLLHGWAFAVAASTALRIDVLLLADGDLELLISGNNAQGEPVETFRYHTLHGHYDFSAPRRWEPEWQAVHAARSPL